MVVHTMRALTDNYCYILQREGSRLVAVVDPSEAAPIDRYLTEHGLSLGLILNTHHHHDHVGGNLELAQKWGAEIYCSAVDFDRVPRADRGFKDHEKFSFDQMEFEVLAIPGHTLGQIAYLQADSKALFVGDTVFAMGCGRLFEGTPAAMFESLAKIMRLGDETRIYFGHEYTETNAAFAMRAEPDNQGIRARLEEVRASIRIRGSAEAPRLGDEKMVNPFFRSASPAIRKTLGLDGASDLEVFTKLREMRNVF